MSKGKENMGKVITRKLNVGDKFKLPGNPFQTYEVVAIKGDYLIYKNLGSHEEYQMVRGFAQTVDLLDESADYQKKRFKEPYYMYNESAKTIKESSETKKDYLKYIDQFEKDVKKYIDWMKRDVKENKEIVLPDVVVSLATAITNAMNRYNNAVKTKTLTEGFMVKEKLGNTYIGRFDSKDKAEKAVKDLAKRRGQSEADWVVEPDDKYMAAATAKGASSWGPIPMNTLTESFIIQDSDSNNKPVYFRYGKYTGYDWGFDKNAATKFSTKEAAERMIEKMRQEGMLINSMKVVSEGRIAKGYENLDAEEKARHLLSHPSSKYMNDLKSENITERAIRKAVKEMLGKPDKRDPQFITDVNEGCIKESVYYIKSPSGFYVMKTDNSYDLTDDKEKALKYTIGNDAAKELAYIHRYSPDSRLKKLMVVQEEGEAPAASTTTANVANPDLPLKLKEDLESDKAEALEDYKKAKAEYLANKSDENWKKFSDAKAKCMQLGCRI